MLKISVKYFLLILIISNVLSCNRNHTPEGIAVVDINPNQEASTKKLSELISSIDYVLLKSGNSSFLANINDAIFFKNNYYVLDKFQNSIVKFDETGNYVDKFRFVGNGPGEYNKIDFFDINRKLETFEIYDVRKGTIFRYDLFGNFQKSTKSYINM